MKSAQHFRASLREQQERIESEGALLVHACAFLVRGLAVLSPAPSGGGKSTLAAQLPLDAILSDERILLRPAGDGYEVALPPPPFRGARIGRPQPSAPLCAILFPERSPGLRLLPCPGPTALLRLASQCFTLALEDGRGQEHLERCGRVVASVPCARLAYTAPIDILTTVEKWLLGTT
ncbi:MAG: hypothetical protein HY608_11940 [Planctomycetes bacterium]|nr:hypothetical protein [Planctomycetota bacterium]